LTNGAINQVILEKKIVVMPPQKVVLAIR